MRIAIAGYGGAGELHAALLSHRPGIRIVGIADQTATRRAAASAKFPEATLTGRLDELDVPIDAVIVCTPPASHASDIRTALIQHGAHVLCEKPAVLNPAEGRHQAAVARNDGLVLHPVHNYLHSPAISELHALATGTLDEITHVTVDIARTGPSNGHRDWRPGWRTEPAAGGGILYDHGPHACYLACHLLDQKAVSVRCDTSPGPLGADHTARLSLRFANGATATVSLSWAAASRGNTYLLRGANGSAYLHNGHLHVATATATVDRDTEDHSAGGHANTAWIRTTHQSFFDRIDSRDHSDTWDTAVHVAEILRAARRSAACGGQSVVVSAELGELGPDVMDGG